MSPDKTTGHKVVIVGGIQGVDCEHDIYQPFKYWTNGSSTCAFKKNPCNAEGQVIHDNGTTKTDRQCRCDYSKGYDFIKKPKYACYCESSKEDCSCYQKQCPYGFVLTPDYNCIHLTNWSMKSTCSMIPDNTDTRDKERPLMQISKRDNEKGIKKSSSMLRVVLSIFIGLVKIMIFVSALLIGMGVICSSQNQIPKDILDLQIKRKKEWKIQFNDFFETAAFTVILNRIRQEQFVIVSGPAGCGKSSSTFHAALNLEKYDLWIITDPGDILKYSSADTKQIFLIDDAFGRYTVSQNHIIWWSQQGCSIKDILKGNIDLKVVMTCRSYIYRSVTSIETIEPFCHVNLLSDDLKLTLEERQTIGKGCINSETENIDRISNEVIMLYNFFPSLCSKFHEVQNDVDMIEYFTFPYHYIAEEIKQFRTADDPLYLALAFLVIRGNEVDKIVLNPYNDECNRVLENLFNLSDISGYTGRPSKSVLLSCFSALEDLYVLDNESSFECLHEKLFIMIAHCVGPDILNIILDHGKSSLIKERVRLTLTGENISKFYILVPEVSKLRFFLRLLTDLQNGKSEIVFSSFQHTLPKFRKLFRDYLVTNLKERLKGDKHQIAVNVVKKLGYREYVSCLNGLE
ncbi:uncharacterized protein LOC127714293 isoform X2 [Mytilus californianus]|uniref:uncharacterized protein LOC127714293 isoform X2 n=1 Tax=Mytilus californianus TaxID=6549 RepID=UPI002246F1C7|nr:uncharacterized protein LOC127714293 isoform X2 [Mytilus californianus]